MRATLLSLSLLTLGGFLLGCQPTARPGTTDGGDSPAPGQTPDGGDGGTGGAPPGPVACPAPCGTGEVCSVTGVCIAAGTCASDDDCQEGMLCDSASSNCAPGSSCGAVEVTGAIVEPTLFISLDRSCSMKNKVGGKPKWTIAVEALDKLLTDQAGKIRFGLGLFPDTVGNSCQQGAAAVPVSAGTESTIRSLLASSLSSSDANYPDGPCVTNIDTAVLQAADEPAFSDATRKHYVLLVTDGAQAGCNSGGGDNGTEQTIKTLKMGGVTTFVVGFGAGVDAAALNAFADAGGAPSGDPTTRYYKAENQASLETALANIAKQTLGCNYALTQTPPDPARLFVFFENTQAVPRDPTHQGGWDYDAASNQVSFFGQTCEDLKAGLVQDLDIVLGCAQPSIN